MLKIILLFLRVGFFYRDTNAIGEILYQSLVIKNKNLTEDDWNSIQSILKFPFGSYKISYAIAIGKQMSTFVFGLLLALVVCLPGIILYASVYLLLQKFLNTEQLGIVVNATYPVLAAYFIYCSYDYLKGAFHRTSLVKFVTMVLISFILVFVLELNVILVLLLSMFLLLCFTKGGKIDE